VGASLATGFTDRDQQFGVRASNCEVVADDRQAVDDVIEELAPRTSTLAGRELDSDAEFGDRDRCNGGLVVVTDQVVEIERCAFGLDEDAGVQQEQRQNRSSVVNWFRKATSSPLQSVSTRWRRRSAFASAPVATIAGSSWAMTRPRRTIVYLSPRCSTPSSRSAKRLDASVAVTSITGSDYLMTCPAATNYCDGIHASPRTKGRASDAGCRVRVAKTAVTARATT